MFNSSLIHIFQGRKTPFYHYDMGLLNRTLQAAKEALPANYKIHYALKANCNLVLLEEIQKVGFGADCVSGNEIRQALKAGFQPEEIVFAGVGKTDDEMRFALEANISCFNCESLQELEVLAEIAASSNKVAPIALRLNPNIDALTHPYITTGLEDNKFGIGLNEIERAIDFVKDNPSLSLNGVHFHIGSQIRDISVFDDLARKANEIIEWLADKNIQLNHINLGGGLGVDYVHPDTQPIPDFATYFAALNINADLPVHVELGRSLVAQCGTLVTRALYIKEGNNKDFVVVDAGMTELLRPALYSAQHRVDNISSAAKNQKNYSIVGPICESSDRFAKEVTLPETKRGDLLVIRTCGAYAESMTLSYNMRDKAQSYFYAGEEQLIPA